MSDSIDLNQIVKDLKKVNVTPQKTSKNKFTHSNEITIISPKSQYKGLDGTVVNYFPSNLILVTYDHIYVKTKDYHKIPGDTIIRSIRKQNIDVIPLDNGNFRLKSDPNVELTHDPKFDYFVVKRQQTIPIKLKHVKLMENNKKAKVLKEPYKNKILDVLYYKPSYLEISLHSNGQIIPNILPDDVFYKDFILNSGEYAQLISINNENKDLLNVKIKKSSNNFENTTISKTFIKEILPGMSFQKKQQEEYNDVHYLNNEKEDSETYLSSYTDSNMSDSSLTKNEKYVKTSVGTILNCLNVNENMIEYQDVYNSVISIIDHIKNEKLYSDDIFNSSNIKYIILLLSLYKYIESPFNNYDLDIITKNIYKCFIKAVDLNNTNLSDTIFINKTDKNQIDIIKKFIKTKSYSNILKIIIINTDKYIRQYLPNVPDLNNLGILAQFELVPLGKRKRSDVSNMSVKQLLNGDLSEVEVPIMWGPYNLNIITNIQNKLNDKIISASDESFKKYLEYIKNNLYRAPFSIRDDPIPSSVKNYFQTIYNILLDTIRKTNPTYKKEYMIINV